MMSYASAKEYYKNVMGQETFEFEGESYAYPITVRTENGKREYRCDLAHQLIRLRHEEELAALPLKEKVRRYSKNAGLEMLATALELPGVLMRLGGMHYSLDGIRGMKEETLYSYRKLEGYRDFL